jgi:hypothetical protein
MIRLGKRFCRKTVIEFSMPIILGMLIKVCLIETCSEVRKGRHLFATNPIQSGVKQGDILL